MIISAIVGPMKHSVALKIVKAALAAVDPQLRVTLSHQERLPSHPKTEVGLFIDTGPGTMCSHAWIKKGVLQQTEAGNPAYTYWDLDNPDAVAKWAGERKNLIRAQTFKAAWDKYTDPVTGEIDIAAANKELGIG